MLRISSNSELGLILASFVSDFFLNVSRRAAKFIEQIEIIQFMRESGSKNHTNDVNRLTTHTHDTQQRLTLPSACREDEG